MLVEVLVDVDPGDAPMTDLVIRKLLWTFDTSVPFQWQSANPLARRIRLPIHLLRHAVREIHHECPMGCDGPRRC